MQLVIDLSIFLLISLALIHVTWLYYRAGMSALPLWQAGKLSKTTKALCIPDLIVFLFLDVALNILMNVFFFNMQKEWLFTGRLNRYLREDRLGWRGKTARWMCDHMLNPFDPRGNHCIDALFD